MSEASDEMLMRRVCDGDKEAFAVLVRRHIDALYGYALRLTMSAGNAEDLVQETWLAAWQNAGRYRADKAGLPTWLHRILHNKFVDGTRKRQPVYDQQVIDTLSNDAAFADTPGDPEVLPRLNRLINSLPENQKAALTLAHIQGFSNKEVAHILGISVRATESILSRARRALRQQLSDA